MKITMHPLGEMKANCYLIEEDENCILIDPGEEASFILEEIDRKHLHLLGLIATHGHFDHVMAVGEIQCSFKARFNEKIPLYICEKDLFLLKRLDDTAKHFLSEAPVIIPITETIDLKKGKQKIDIFSFEITYTPGHTPGSCCIYFPEAQVIFTGDTLFKEGIGRYDFSYSNKVDLYESVKKILSYPEDTVIYSGHGEETTVGDEKSILEKFF